jgi:hypothetical protein
MIKQSAIAALIALATLAGAPAAKADSFNLTIGIDGPVTTIGSWERGYGGWDRGHGGWDRPSYDLISPRKVVRILYRRGFDEVSIVRQRGPNYIAEAIGPRGNRVRVVVDARTADIVGIRVIGWAHDRPRGYGWDGRQGRDGWDGSRL